ncbi:MAG: hypothetical protein IJ524_02900 [Bacteroidales bacterium]|nr:hypothetical protein [Bacteroidales bacterium]
MKHEEIDNLIDRLQGFDTDELQSAMSDGFDEWCQRRQQRGRTLRRLAVVALLLLTSTALAMSVVPQWRPAFFSGGAKTPVQSACAPAPKPQPHVAPVDTVSVTSKTDATVDYTYFGRSEEGYSVTYGVDSRTLIYTRRVGNRIISSFVHNASDSLFADSVTDTLSEPVVDGVQAASDMQEEIVYDFLSTSPQGDTLLFAIVDSMEHRVSVYSNENRFGRCHDSLVLPTWVFHDGERYTVTVVDGKAFAGSAIRALVLPASVQVVSDSAFADCWRLRKVLVLGEVPPRLGANAFASIDRKALLTVPCHTADVYDTASRWGVSFGYNIEEDCAGVQEVEPQVAIVRVGRGEISVSGVDEQWWVYDLRGQRVASHLGEGTVKINVPGTYVVIVGDQLSQKVMVTL